MRKSLLKLAGWCLLFCCIAGLQNAYSQQSSKNEIRGTVRDSTGTMPGVSVFVKASPTIGTTTDLNGKYILDVPGENSILVFKMVGYETVEVPVKGKTVIDVTIRFASNTLDEAVVVAFGTQKKESVIGSITTINPTELKVPSSNLTTALAGRLAGVIAYQRSGEPGRDNAEFFIRGATTFGYKTSPLILIDNMEYSATDLARLQPDDIESFSIMKDAASAALYGAKGANGVILVTTKQGKEGKPKIDLRVENSVASPTKNIELADPITYMKLHNESYVTRQPNTPTPYSQYKIDNTIAGINPIAFPTVNWQDEMLRSSTLNQRANFSLSGGGQIANYYVSGTLNQDNGILKEDTRNNFDNNIKLKSYNLRSNIGINVSKTTNLQVRLNGNFDDYKGPLDGGEALYQKIMRANPVLFLPSYPSEYGTAKHIMFGNAEQGNYLNPYADMVQGYKEESRSLMVAQLELKQDLGFITPGLAYNAMGNVNRTAFFNLKRTYFPFWYAVGSYDRFTDTPQLSVLNPDTGTDYLNYVPGQKDLESVFHFQNAVTYNRTFKKHTIGGMTVLILRSKLDGNANSLQSALPARNLGVSGRATYAYANKYFAEFNFGYNGSERFFKSERYGFFPSAGLAWQISNEKFFEPLLNTISKLRVRGNIGLVGQDEIGDENDRFFYLSEVDMNGGSGASFGTNGGYSRDGITVNRYENRDITWETARNSTFGLEVGLWNKLDIIAEYFTEERYNILMDRASIPKTMGLQGATPKANVGRARSRSAELQLDYGDTFGKDGYINILGNFTYAKNLFRSYEEPAYDEPWLYRVGHPVRQQWGYIAERLFVDDEEVRSSPRQVFGNFQTMGGDIKFRDVNGDGQISPLDMVPIGHPTSPEIIYGFGVSVKFKGFDISTFLQGSAQSSFWIDASATSPFTSHTYSSDVAGNYLGYISQGVPRFQNQLLAAYADDHWSEENRDLYALWPRLSPVLNQNSNQRNTWFMRDGSFLRLKQVEAGYTFPRKLTQRARLENVRIYATMNNAYTWSKFKLWDVEMAGNGLGYPNQRVLNFGLQVGL